MYRHILKFTDRNVCEQAEEKLHNIFGDSAEIEGLKESGLDDDIDCIFFTSHPLIMGSKRVVIHETQPTSYNFNDLQA